MKVHILGICGTFMAGIATIAKQLGHEVRGCDANVYPPMSTQLQEQGIELTEGYGAAQLDYQPDMVIIGNTMKRSIEVVEAVLNRHLPYMSGPQWLAEYVLQQHDVLAVAGTHGKTTTSSMLAWILECSGKNPGFLIGGVPQNFSVSARVTDSDYFVIEADEYDSAFFDKRSKFVHYHPRTLIMNNLEFDHADIFVDLAAIQKQFHQLVRTVPGEGQIIMPANEPALAEVIEQGCWTPIQYVGSEWQAELVVADGSEFHVLHQKKCMGTVRWNLLGNHNVANALAAIAASVAIGITTEQAIAALATFANVKRRMELKGVINNITIYDDFAHHPTAIATTLAGLRAKVGKQRIIAVAELGSYTMRLGSYQQQLPDSFAEADRAILYVPSDANWDVEALASPRINVLHEVDAIVQQVVKEAQSGDIVLVMSNRGFGGIHHKLLQQLA